MTQTAIKLTAHVLPGKRLEVYAPELVEGTDVELIVLQSEAPASPQIEEPMGVWDYIQSLPPSNLTMEDWERIEREFRAERDSWGD